MAFSDPDSGTMLHPSEKVFAATFKVDATASTITASVAKGVSFKSSKGRVQVELLFDSAPQCGLYNGVGGANDHAGVIATPWRINATLPTY